MKEKTLLSIKSPSPKSRRYFTNKWHPYGWQVSFEETVNNKREYHSGVGINRKLAIQHAIKKHYYQ
jgi:hypothetical protein